MIHRRNAGRYGTGLNQLPCLDSPNGRFFGTLGEIHGDERIAIVTNFE